MSGENDIDGMTQLQSISAFDFSYAIYLPCGYNMYYEHGPPLGNGARHCGSRVSEIKGREIIGMSDIIGA
jgi:hypothetical protein